MNKGKGPKRTGMPTQIGPPKAKLGIGQPETTFKPFQPVKKKSWSNAQWEQSKSFWAKKSLRTFQALDQRRIKAEDTFMSSLPQKRQAELDQLSAMKLVKRPVQTRMPNADPTQLVAPKQDATKRYHDFMSDIGEFLDPKAEVRSTHNPGGPQMIQQFTNQTGLEVTRRVGVDIEPSGHVQQLKPHLNLQTQHGGKIQKGLLQDPHHPILSSDPFEQTKRQQHPLQGKLTSDEKRAFMERYVHSLGIPIKRK